LKDPLNLVDRLPEALRPVVRTGIPLDGLTTLRVGGPAGLICPVHNPDHAQRFQGFARDSGTPFFILGGGSNVLADDRGYGGLILHVTADELSSNGDVIRVGAGHSFDGLIACSLDLGLTGLEFASGIPGTVGGAVVGNAGCYGHEIGEFLVEAVILTRDGNLMTVGPDSFGFRYRETDLRETGAVVLEVTLKLNRGDVHTAGQVRADRIADRRAKHPVDLPSAGSWFRNLPPGTPGGRRQAAGHLLEQAGAKDMHEGDARVFPKHANIIVNSGAASSADVRTLAHRMKQAVKKMFGVDLQEEVRYLDPDEGSPTSGA